MQFPVIIRRMLPKDDWGDDLALYFQQKPYYYRKTKKDATCKFSTNSTKIQYHVSVMGDKFEIDSYWCKICRQEMTLICGAPRVAGAIDHIMNYRSTNHRIITVLSVMTLLPVGMKVALYSRTAIRIFIRNHRWDNHGLFRDDLKQPLIELYFDHVVQKWERDEDCQRKHWKPPLRVAHQVNKRRAFSFGKQTMFLSNEKKDDRFSRREMRGLAYCSRDHTCGPANSKRPKGTVSAQRRKVKMAGELGEFGDRTRGERGLGINACTYNGACVIHAA